MERAARSSDRVSCVYKLITITGRQQECRAQVSARHSQEKHTHRDHRQQSRTYSRSTGLPCRYRSVQGCPSAGMSPCAPPGWLLLCHSQPGPQKLRQLKPRHPRCTVPAVWCRLCVCVCVLWGGGALIGVGGGLHPVNRHMRAHTGCCIACVPHRLEAHDVARTQTCCVIQCQQRGATHPSAPGHWMHQLLSVQLGS